MTLTTDPTGVAVAVPTDRSAVWTLRVTDFETAEASAIAWADKTVALLDPLFRTSWARRHPDHHGLFFEDTEPAADDPDGPTRAHLDAVLAVGASMRPGERLLIHCLAGMSRSTAAAIAVLVQAGHAADAAFEAIRRLREPTFWPNQVLIRLADQRFGLDGALAGRVWAWKLDQRARLEDRPDAGPDDPWRGLKRARLREMLAGGAVA